MASILHTEVPYMRTEALFSISASRLSSYSLFLCGLRGVISLRELDDGLAREILRGMFIRPDPRSWPRKCAFSLPNPIQSVYLILRNTLEPRLPSIVPLSAFEKARSSSSWVRMGRASPHYATSSAASCGRITAKLSCRGMIWPPSASGQKRALVVRATQFLKSSLGTRADETGF